MPMLDGAPKSRFCQREKDKSTGGLETQDASKKSAPNWSERRRTRPH